MISEENLLFPPNTSQLWVPGYYKQYCHSVSNDALLRLHWKYSGTWQPNPRSEFNQNMQRESNLILHHTEVSSMATWWLKPSEKSADAVWCHPLIPKTTRCHQAVSEFGQIADMLQCQLIAWGTLLLQWNTSVSNSHYQSPLAWSNAIRCPMITTIPVSNYYELLLYHWLLLCSIQGIHPPKHHGQVSVAPWDVIFCKHMGWLCNRNLVWQSLNSLLKWLEYGKLVLFWYWVWCLQGFGCWWMVFWETSLALN